jgi:hypothetical protein
MNVKEDGPCCSGECVHVMEVTNKAGETDYLIGSNRRGAPKGDVEIFTQSAFDKLVRDTATQNFARNNFSATTQEQGETRFHLNNPTGIKAGERPVYTLDEVQGAAIRLNTAPHEVYTPKVKRAPVAA